MLYKDDAFGDMFFKFGKLLLIIYFIFPLKLIAQYDSVAYSRNYEFVEGVFLNGVDFKFNRPISKLKIISNIPKEQLDFIKQIMESRTIHYRDSIGKEILLDKLSVWGYCQNRSIYINFNNEFNRLNVVGTLCHFTATFEMQVNYRDNFSYNATLNNSVQELRHYVYDTQTNTVFDFNVKNMELLLKNDADLYLNFMNFKKRQKSEAIFIYLRKYNENHPFYLPVIK